MPSAWRRTLQLADFYLFAFAIIVAQMRWFIAKTTLGLADELAALIVAIDFGLGVLIHRGLAAMISH